MVCMKVLVHLTVFLIREVGEKSGMVRVEDKILSFIWSGELWQFLVDVNSKRSPVLCVTIPIVIQHWEKQKTKREIRLA